MGYDAPPQRFFGALRRYYTALTRSWLKYQPKPHVVSPAAAAAAPPRPSRRIPGNTLAVQPDKPFQGLADFGTGFLSRFEGSSTPSRLLEEITLVDTPGVLSGEKQRLERQYNFNEIVEWFAARCDMILLLFDPYKLDISDEFKDVIQSCLRGHDDKVCV